MFTYLALVSPPVALAIDVFARTLAAIGRGDDEDLKALRPGLVASPRTGRDAHRVPFLELDDRVVDLHPAAPAQDHVHLLLLLVRVAVGKAIAGRDALVAQPDFSSSSASVAKRNSRSGAPSNLEPTSSRSSLMFLSVNGTSRSYDWEPKDQASFRNTGPRESPQLQESTAPLRKARARAPRDPSARRARAARSRPAGRAADGAVGRHRRASRACDRRAGCPVHRRSRRASRR